MTAIQRRSDRLRQRRPLHPPGFLIQYVQPRQPGNGLGRIQVLGPKIGQKPIYPQVWKTGDARRCGRRRAVFGHCRIQFVIQRQTAGSGGIAGWAGRIQSAASEQSRQYDSSQTTRHDAHSDHVPQPLDRSQQRLPDAPVRSLPHGFTARIMAPVIMVNDDITDHQEQPCAFICCPRRSRRWVPGWAAGWNTWSSPPPGSFTPSVTSQP